MGEERRFESLDGGTSGAGGIARCERRRKGRRDIHSGRTGNAETGVGKLRGFLGLTRKACTTGGTEGHSGTEPDAAGRPTSRAKGAREMGHPAWVTGLCSRLPGR